MKKKLPQIWNPKMGEVDYLTLMHLNINSVRNKTELLNYYIKTYNPHIILLNETKLDPTINLDIVNYNIYRHDISNRQGGVAIGIKNNLTATQNHIFSDKDQVVSIKLFNNNRDYVNIVSYYNPPSNYVNAALFDR